MNRILSLIGVVLVVGCGGLSPNEPFESYYDNGQLESRGTFKNGEFDGPYELYHENGPLILKWTYRDGELDGPSETYHDNGQLRTKGTYRDGKKSGGWLDFGETVTYDPC